MNKLLLIYVLTIGIVFSLNDDLHCQSSNQVLLFIRDGSGDLNYTLKAEVSVMKKILEQAGFTVVIASVSGEPLVTDSINITPDLKLGDVRVNDYLGFILPCMHAGASLEKVNPQAVLMVKQAVLDNKPIAVQHASIMTLALAEVLQGKQYTYHAEVNVNDYPNFKGSDYKGRGVIRDGNIITSGICPYLGMLWGIEDGTEQLTRLLIATINEIAE
jgi:putative intracellular protease/amidase